MSDDGRLTSWPLRAKVVVGGLAILLVVVASIAAVRQAPPRQRSAGPLATTSSTTAIAAAPDALPAPLTTGIDVVPPTPSTTPGPAAPEPPQPSLAQLRVADVARTQTGYSRDLFPTWLDLDGNGCDAREDSLIAESLIAASVDRSGGCEVLAGRWLSIYDGVEVTEPSNLDVDHLVPLAEAWRSGASAWDGARRAAYANDLTFADHLIAVTAATNRSKSDSPPNEWRPPRQDSWCRYATDWITIKLTWALTATTPERDALGQMLETC
ncbi:MAG: HNH endonuclease family protein [Acidimicrobiales bacterium]